MKKLSSSAVTQLKGSAPVPGDKSISHRSLMFGVLAEGDTLVTGMLEGEDVLRTARALISFGANIIPPEHTGGPWRVSNTGQKPLRSPHNTIYLGNSGTSARLLMGMLAGYPVSGTFTGDESLSRRPMGRVIKPLSLMGAQFETSKADLLPLRMTGMRPLRSINYTLPVASAQVKSAILLAALHANGATVVTEPAPTRDHTERLLRYFGAKVEELRHPDGSNTISIVGFPRLIGHHIQVPADPSSAAFPTVAALIVEDSDILISRVCINEGRIGLYTTLQEMGADITFTNIREASGESVADIQVKSSRLKGITVPEKRVPSMIDEFPVLAVAASFAEGKTVMSGLGELKVKESNRLAAIVRGLEACGVTVEESDEGMVIHGTGKKPKGGALIQTHLDHRIAMSFLVMGMASQEPVIVDDASPIATSFPNFIALMNGLGAKLHEPAV